MADIKDRHPFEGSRWLFATRELGVVLHVQCPGLVEVTAYRADKLWDNSLSFRADRIHTPECDSFCKGTPGCTRTQTCF